MGQKTEEKPDDGDDGDFHRDVLFPEKTKPGHLIGQFYRPRNLQRETRPATKHGG